jgi:hypothetical protein
MSALTPETVSGVQPVARGAIFAVSTPRHMIAPITRMVRMGGKKGSGEHYRPLSPSSIKARIPQR